MARAQHAAGSYTVNAVASAAPAGADAAGSSPRSARIQQLPSALCRAHDSKRGQLSSSARRALLGLLSTVAWMLASSLLIVLNKHIYTMGFRFPMALTGMGQAMSALGGWVMAAAGLMPLRPPPPRRQWLHTLGPVVTCCGLTMFLGNAAYLHLGVAFIQILKATTPAIVLGLAALAGLEAATPPLLGAVALIALGTGVCVQDEAADPTFSWLGLLLFLLSSLTEAGRVVASQQLLGGSRFNTAEALVYISAPSAALLLGAAALFEGGGLAAGGTLLMANHPALFVGAAAMSFLVNLTSYWAIASTGSLTFKVAGCVKNLGVVAYSTVAYGEHVGPWQVSGYIVSVAGFLLYSWAKANASPQTTLQVHSSGGGPQQQLSRAQLQQQQDAQHNSLADAQPKPSTKHKAA